MAGNNKFSNDEIRKVAALHDLNDSSLASEAGLLLKNERLMSGTENGDVGSREFIDFDIIDGRKLLLFFKMVDSDVSSVLKPLINGLASRVGLKFIYDEDNRSEVALTITSIAAELERLGLKNNAESFRRMFAWYERGCLDQYKAALDADMFNSTSGPESWNADMPSDFVRERWYKAYGVFREMISNDIPKELLQSIKEYLLESADKALLTKPTRESEENAAKVGVVIKAFYQEILNSKKL